MIRFFQAEDIDEILKLSRDFNGEVFNVIYFLDKFEDIINGSEDVCGIAVLHAGEYLGYCLAYVDGDKFMIIELYIKPAFQKLKVSQQVFDFIEAEFPNHRYRALVPKDNEIANKVFKRRGYDIYVM